MLPVTRAVTSPEFNNRLIEVVKSNRIRLIGKNITSQLIKPSYVMLALIGYLVTEIVFFVFCLHVPPVVVSSMYGYNSKAAHMNNFNTRHLIVYVKQNKALYQLNVFYYH